MTATVGVDKSVVIDRVLHWVSALLVLFMLMEMGGQIHLTDYQVKGFVDHRYDAYVTHMMLGGLLTVLLIARLFWSHKHPSLAKRLNFSGPFHRHFVSIYHKLFYLILFVMVITGVIAMGNGEVVIALGDSQLFPFEQVNKRLFNQALDIHLFLEDLLYLYILIHVLGALHNKK